MDGAAPAALPAELLAARASIDELDGDLIDLLSSRFALTRRIGQLKADLGLPASDPARQAVQIERLRALAVVADVNPDLAADLLNLIMAEVVRQHQQVRRPGLTG